MSLYGDLDRAVVYCDINGKPCEFVFYDGRYRVLPRNSLGKMQQQSTGDTRLYYLTLNFVLFNTAKKRLICWVFYGGYTKLKYLILRVLKVYYTPKDT